MEAYNPMNSLLLYQLGEKLEFLIKLYKLNKFPKVLMLSGEKGIGKFTLINHFMCHVFDEKNYNLDERKINKNSKFYKDNLNKIFSNIIYLSGENFNKAKIDNIRQLKSTLLKSSYYNKERFIILDDIELFNLNSINALLRVIEEPYERNYFILINNKTKALIDTISSRALEFKIFLNNKTKIEIIKNLIETFKIKYHIDFHSINISPGNFLLFNQICEEHKISISDDYLSNFELLLKLFKKNKDFNLINLIKLITDIYFFNLNKKDNQIERNINDKQFVINNINNFITYNLNHTSLLNAINDRIVNE